MHRAQCFSTARAHMQQKQWRILDFEIRADQTLETFYFNLCNCLAWGQTDSDKVRSNLYIYVKIM